MKRTVLLSALALALLAPFPASAADVSASYQPADQTLWIDLPAGTVPTLVESERPARLTVTLPHETPTHAESLAYAHGLVSRLVVANQGGATVVTLDFRQPLHGAYRLDFRGGQLAISLMGAIVAPPSLPPRPLPSKTPTPHATKKPMAKPSAKPTTKPSPRPVAKLTPKPVVKHTPRPIAKPTPKPTPKPMPTPSTMSLASPLPLPVESQGVLLPGASPLPTPGAMATSTVTPTPRPTPNPTPMPAPSKIPSPRPTPKATPKPSATPAAAEIRAVKPAAGTHVHVGALSYDEDTRFLMVPISGRVVPIYTSTANPPQLIIDLPDTVVGETQRHRYSNALVTEAIAYQHTPTETRIILTFARPIGENWVMKQTPKNLILIFDRRPVSG